MRCSYLACFVLSLLPAPALRAQSFNVDVGTQNGVPSPLYGAAAGQRGTWNPISASQLSTPHALTSLQGTASPATLTLVSGQAVDFGFDNPFTTGDDQLLLDDWQDAAGTGGSSTWRFSNLAAGNYTLTTYAWASDSATFLDSVSCGTIDPPQTCGGIFTGLVQGVTHAVHRVSLASSGSIDVTITTVASAATVNGFQLHRDVFTTAFCTGEVAGSTCVACGNNGAAGRGCANSSFASGARLTATGLASVGFDSLSLQASEIPGPGLFFQAAGLSASPVTLGDGMLCAAVGIVRLGVVFPAAGIAVFPGGLTPIPIHVGGAPINPGDVKHYQCWYRDAVSFCTPSTFNLTNGVSLTWEP